MDNIFKLENPEHFKTVSQEIISSLYYNRNMSESQLDPSAIERAKHEFRTIISDCDFNIKKVSLFLTDKGFDQENVTLFAALLEKHLSELIGAAFNYYNSNHGETVINFDWLVKYIFGTSELKTINYPLLQLLLTTTNKSGEQKRLTYDIHQDMLLKMINVLENII